jgi:hypothetical protein
MQTRVMAAFLIAHERICSYLTYACGSLNFRLSDCLQWMTPGLLQTSKLRVIQWRQTMQTPE